MCSAPRGMPAERGVSSVLLSWRVHGAHSPQALPLGSPAMRRVLEVPSRSSLWLSCVLLFSLVALTQQPSLQPPSSCPCFYRDRCCLVSALGTDVV